jgi:hypothetical protein
VSFQPAISDGRDPRGPHRAQIDGDFVRLFVGNGSQNPFSARHDVSLVRPFDGFLRDITKPFEGDSQRSSKMVNMLSFDFVNNVSFAPASVGLDTEVHQVHHLSQGNRKVNKEWLEHDSNLDPLRSHPRFFAMMEKLG